MVSGRLERLLQARRPAGASAVPPHPDQPEGATPAGRPGLGPRAARRLRRRPAHAPREARPPTRGTGPARGGRRRDR